MAIKADESSYSQRFQGSGEQCGRYNLPRLITINHYESQLITSIQSQLITII